MQRVSFLISSLTVASENDCFKKMAYPFGHWTSLRGLALLASIDDFFKSNRVALKAGSSFEIVPKIRQACSRPEMSVVRTGLWRTLWLNHILFTNG